MEQDATGEDGEKVGMYRISGGLAWKVNLGTGGGTAEDLGLGTCIAAGC